MSADDDTYAVESIVDHQLGKTKSKHTFKVRWDGYSSAHDSWLPYSGVKDLQALDAYLQAHQELRL